MAPAYRPPVPIMAVSEFLCYRRNRIGSGSSDIPAIETIRQCPQVFGPVFSGYCSQDFGQLVGIQPRRFLRILRMVSRKFIRRIFALGMFRGDDVFA